MIKISKTLSAILALTSMFFVGLSTIAFKEKPSVKETQPNIIIVNFDDMGYGDLDITGAIGYHTPNMDKMAKEGMFFSQLYSAQAVCSASRTGLLTGCYPNRIGISGALGPNSKIGIGANELTIAEMLRAKGYATAAFGKWHLGHLPEFLPLQHGFDVFFGIPYSHDMWPHHPTNKTEYPPLPLIEGNTTVQTNPDLSMFTTWFTERSISFIEQNKNKPFFLYLAHPLPHVPLAVSNKFKGKSAQGMYGDVVMELDWSIGQIREALAKLHLEKNTLLIVTSDNGPWLNYGNHAGSTGGLREGKGTSFEGGQRVPCIMSWPGVIPAGTVNNQMASEIDFLPTIAAITGAAVSSNKIDGVNIFPLLKGQMDSSPRKSFLYYYRANSLEAIRYENYKLVFPHPGRTYEGYLPGKDGMPGPNTENFQFPAGLYDLRRDPGERYNLIDQLPEVVAQLTKLANEARADLGDDLTNNLGTNRRAPGKSTK
ncbi:MAG: sulfatase [Bacteroidetes bacterium]|nr:sulfatase [Bacteroidota bacterium]